MRKALLLAACLAALCAAARGADEATDENARKIYAGAFAEGLSDDERTELLENIVRDFADTRWSDDALWVMAQAADAEGDRGRAVLLRRQLLQMHRDPRLERFTRSLPVYENSRMPRVIFLLERTGHRYTNDAGRAVPFNPIPMVTCEDLAAAYEDMDLPELALGEYRRALTAAPPDGLFARIYRRRIERIEGKLNPPEETEPADAQPVERTDQEPPPEEETAAENDETGLHKEPSEQEAEEEETDRD